MFDKQKIQAKKAFKNKSRPAVALLLCAALLTPTLVQGAAITDDIYANNGLVGSGWDPNVYEKDLPRGYETTGLAYNYTQLPNSLTGTGNRYPFDVSSYLTQRAGYKNEKYADFNNRFIYCVQNHVPNYYILRGMQAFRMHEYKTTEAAGIAKGTADNVKFNFLMLAIACGYPAKYDPENMADIPYNLICQTIAWCVTNDRWNDGTGKTEDQWPINNGAFNGAPAGADQATITACFNADLDKYHTSAEYKSLFDSFPPDTTPEIYAALHKVPSGSTGGLDGFQPTNLVDAVFHDIWIAAYITSQLQPNWDESITATYTTAEKEDDGYYHAYINLFNSDEAKTLLQGVTPETYGDWEYLGETPNVGGTGNVLHFRSLTGKRSENGDIATLSWKGAEGIQGLLPIDETKAKLYTFGFYNNRADDPTLKFNNAQTYFSSVIEQGLDIHVRLGSGDPDSDVEVHRHEHIETMTATYNVSLAKFDSETGKPLADSHWDILERFDDSQLDGTDLDVSPDNVGEYVSGLGSLGDTEAGDDDVGGNYDGDTGVNMSQSTRYNWANDDGSQFERWDDPEDDPCDRDDNVTGTDGKLYEIDSSGNITGNQAHTDIKTYTYHKGYCDGHPAPKIEYIECDHAPEENCDCEEKNKQAHDDAWEKWEEEVKTCEELVKQGGFFHCISEDGAAKAAMEADRDQFYKDFVSLTYEYSAKETTAPKGYTLHGKHTDDIPVEWRNVTSSEYKATDGGENLDHEAGSAGSGDADTERIAAPDRAIVTDLMTGERGTATSSNADVSITGTSEDRLLAEDDPRIAGLHAERVPEEETADVSNDPGNPAVTDETITVDDEEDRSIATASDATASNAVPEHEIRHTGFIGTVKEAVKGAWDRFVSLFRSPDDPGIAVYVPDSEDGEDAEISRDSVTFEPSEASTIKAADPSILDWTFIAYDHRTEGEIHFNKRDFDLSNDGSDAFDPYGKDNGDGTLEGAVYGLFAAQDIIHPDTDGDGDGDTGVVFKKDDLVAVAATDRNGDGSFLAITEAPGSVYNYETGTIEHTDWYDAAPKNLYTGEEESAGKERDIEAFEGHNPDGSEITAGNGGDLPDTGGEEGNGFKKDSSNQEYDSGQLPDGKKDTWREDATTGSYPIEDNEANNGNCWIGRPLILGKDGSSYYIKELSRSEGYELSVYGKDQTLMTNREAFEAGGDDFTSGTASATAIDRDKRHGGNTFTVKSYGTKNGYILKLTNIPEGAVFHVTTVTSKLDPNVSHKELKEVPVEIDAVPGNYVMLGGSNVRASLGDTVTYNGKTFTVKNVRVIDNSKMTVSPDNRTYVENASLDPAKITETGNVMNDINTLFSKSGFRKVANGCPWISVPVESLTVENVAKAVNELVFADPDYKVFNAMEMIGGFAQNGKSYAAIGYCYRDTGTNAVLYNEQTGKILVKKDVTYKTPGSTLSGFVYRSYDTASCESVVKNANGFVTSAVVPNETASGSPSYARETLEGKVTFTVRPSESYWTYAEGEKLLDSDGNVAVRYEKTYVDVTPTMVDEVTNTELADVSYERTGEGKGTYTIPVSQEFLDRTKDGSLDFRILYDAPYQKIDGMDTDSEYYGMAKGVIGITFPYGTADSYLETVMLMYEGSGTPAVNGGTVKAPVSVYERPVRQRIRVSKDIQTLETPKQVWYCLNCGYENEDGETECGYCHHGRTTEETKTIRYAHDTYSSVHAENLSAERDAGFFATAKDWLTKLMNGENAGESAESLPNFRFKAYLKSNLERLYRSEVGTVAWMDANGNFMTPQYEDADGDGNYDAVTWKYTDAYGGKTLDFPETDKEENHAITSANVQKLYTDVPHEEGSKTTSSRANNVWAAYNDPQKGVVRNAGEKEGFTTSERPTRDGQTGDASGNAVDAAASLYHYTGKAKDAAKSDRINESGEASNSASRLLEMTRQTVEDGHGTRETETYNYEKFFDAVKAANTDVWDGDMHSTFNGTAMKNYPGQHWFETFYEKYQKDDADKDHTLENTDGADRDNTAGGDRDTSFKPFRWIREHVFGDRSDYESYPAALNGSNTEVGSSTSRYAKANAEASDAVRQFAAKWYLKAEAAKLMKDDGNGANIAEDRDGTIAYDEEIYDRALYEAIAKSYTYLKPFYTYDLDTIYAVDWDSAENGGADNDVTTLSIDLDQGEERTAVSAYLPYGTYVIVEQQPSRIDDAVNDWENRSYTVEKPKEVAVPSLYDAAESSDTTDNYDPHYAYGGTMSTEEQAKEGNYLIRFGEEWSDAAPNAGQDDRQYVIRAHNYNGDYEVYKYGLDIDLLNGSESRYSGVAGSDYGGWKTVQDVHDPLKDFYDPDHHGEEGLDAIGTENGGNEAADYMAVDRTDGAATANGSTYDGKALKDRYFYGSISEDRGVADNVLYTGGATDDNNASGMYFKDSVPSMTGELTAYAGKYAPMLVPWSVTDPADEDAYDAGTFTGYADVNERDGFYTTFLRINKTDSETGEYILHDDAVFALYAGSRYQSFDEIRADAKLIRDTSEREKFLAQFKPGDAKFYLQDTEISGTREFLQAMGAKDIKTAVRGRSIVESGADIDEMCTGIVPKGTPVCLESERIMLTDKLGARTGQMTVYSTRNDVKAASEDDPNAKEPINQNTGYFVTPQPVGAGVYVLGEIKAPAGYARSKPVAYEVYSDKTSYYVDGDMYSKVDAVRYNGNLLTDIDYEP